MKNKSSLFLFLLFTIGFQSCLNAQKIGEGETVEVNDLSVTFNVLNKETVDVKGKQYDRYKVSASVKNSSEKSYDIRLTSYPQIADNIGIVELDCINATGAKLTSKKIELKMKSQIINVNYSTYDKNGKSVNTIIPVTGSYYFDAGDTIHDEAIFIVPLGEKPDVTVRGLR